MEILEYLPNEQFWNMQLLCKSIQKMMKEHVWMKTISFRKSIPPYRLEKILNEWKFFDINLNGQRTTSEIIKLLGNCHTLYLNCTKITESLLKMLRKTCSKVIT